MGDRTLYIEKMPEHILRIDDILKAFPNAKFIYLKRPWLPVARSIECISSWFGHSNIKFTSLVESALIRGYLKHPLSMTQSPLQKGIVEWYIH
jgi:hypothetical protein